MPNSIKVLRLKKPITVPNHRQVTQYVPGVTCERLERSLVGYIVHLNGGDRLEIPWSEIAFALYGKDEAPVPEEQPDPVADDSHREAVVFDNGNGPEVMVNTKRTTAKKPVTKTRRKG